MRSFRKVNADPEREVHFNKVLHNVTTDRLTGAYNRQQFIRLAGVEFSRSQRYGHALSIVAIQVDYARPKKANYSNSVASNVMQATARRCLENIRGIDLFGRYSDNTLVILLPETDETAARLVTRRLKENITADPVETNLGPIYTLVDVSLITNHQQTFANVEEMIQQAIQPVQPSHLTREPVTVRNSEIK
jgi:diguanylate cyclase (GGDEF)-like protein